MSEPHIISVDQAKILTSVINPHQPPLRKDWDDHLVYRLANTVIDQADRIASLEMTLFHVEMIVERAQRKGYAPDAYELAEILELEEDA